MTATQDAVASPPGLSISKIIESTSSSKLAIDKSSKISEYVVLPPPNNSEIISGLSVKTPWILIWAILFFLDNIDLELILIACACLSSASGIKSDLACNKSFKIFFSINQSII